MPHGANYKRDRTERGSAPNPFKQDEMLNTSKEATGLKERMAMIAKQKSDARNANHEAGLQEEEEEEISQAMIWQHSKKRKKPESTRTREEQEAIVVRLCTSLPSANRYSE